MSEASEHMEHAEHLSHAAHKGHGGHAAPDPINRFIGLTMALLGVVLALCAAQVGGSRTELIKTMVEQSAAHTKYQAQAIKYRLTLSQLEGLRSVLVTAKDADEAEDSIRKMTTDDSGAALRALASSTRRVIEAGSPHKQDMLRFVGLARKYRAERDAGQDWTESYSAAISGYALAAEHYEHAQLAAEIGIILASIALLLSNRKLWGLSLLVGVVCIGIIAWTYQSTHPRIVAANDEIEHKEKAYRDLRKAQDEKANDEKLLEDIEVALGAGDKPSYAQSPLQ